MNSNPAAVLVIEGHPLMRKALCAAIMEAPDLQVIAQASSVMEALQLVDGIIPDIILLALGRAGDGDVDALTVLRQSLPATPILALTSNEVAGQEQVALKYGAQAVLTKAAPRNELLQRLREHTIK